MAALAMSFVETIGPGVRPAPRGGAQRVVETLTRGFAADPPTRWLYPDPQQYHRYFPRFVDAFGGGAIARGTAFVSGDHAGAALWLPPGTAPDEAALGALLEESVADREKADAFAVFEAMARHHPDRPHWYLPLIGVEPASQGQGHGSALMAHALRQCDRDRLPAYLEATSRRSIPFYERHGFEVVGKVRIGRCPPIFPMLRAAADG